MIRVSAMASLKCGLGLGLGLILGMNLILDILLNNPLFNSKQRHVKSATKDSSFFLNRHFHIVLCCSIHVGHIVLFRRY